MGHLALLVTFLGFISVSWPAAISPPDGVSLIYVVMRHGLRNMSPLPANMAPWQPGGDGQLIALGKQQAYFFGQLLRQRYNTLLGDNFYPDKHVTQASHYPRAQMTMIMAMNGMFPPKTFQVWDPQLQPVGTSFQPFSFEVNDQLFLLIGTMPPCPLGDKIYNDIVADALPPNKDWLAKYKDVINFSANKTGFAPTITGMGSVSDYVTLNHLLQNQIPDWVTGNNPWHQDIYFNITMFAESIFIMCGHFPLCRKLACGPMMQDIVNQIKLKQTGNQTAVAFIAGAHSEQINTCMWVMGVPNNNYFFNCAFIVEYRDQPPSVRVILSVPTRDDTSKRNTMVKIPNFCNNQEWCPFDTFVQGVSPWLIGKDEACRRDTCFCVPNSLDYDMTQKQDLDSGDPIADAQFFSVLQP